MSDFNYLPDVDPKDNFCTYGDRCYLAGQASVEQWEQELYGQMKMYEQRAGVAYEHIAELERERDKLLQQRADILDNQAALVAEIHASYALKAQAGEHVHCENCGYPMYPTTEPVKAQAGESTYTTGHCENHKHPKGCQLHNLHCGYPACDRKAITHPTPERRVPAELIPDHTYETGKRYAINYVAGWNDCRKAMLNAAPKQEETK